jgi:hypothetical protein
MNEHCRPEAPVMTTGTFDGEAISRADREFLASLDDHPLTRHPLYGVPCPPCPSQSDFESESDAQQAARKAAFATAIDWLLVNYAYYKGAFMGKGGVVSLVDG